MVRTSADIIFLTSCRALIKPFAHPALPALPVRPAHAGTLLGRVRTRTAHTTLVSVSVLCTQVGSEHHHALGEEKGREEEGVTMWDTENGKGGEGNVQCQVGLGSLHWPRTKTNTAVNVTQQQYWHLIILV